MYSGSKATKIMEEKVDEGYHCHGGGFSLTVMQF